MFEEQNKNVIRQALPVWVQVVEIKQFHKCIFKALFGSKTLIFSRACGSLTYPWPYPSGFS